MFLIGRKSLRGFLALFVFVDEQATQADKRSLIKGGRKGRMHNTGDNPAGNGARAVDHFLAYSWKRFDELEYGGWSHKECLNFVGEMLDDPVLRRAFFFALPLGKRGPRTRMEPSDMSETLEHLRVLRRAKHHKHRSDYFFCFEEIFLIILYGVSWIEFGTKTAPEVLVEEAISLYSKQKPIEFLETEGKDLLGHYQLRHRTRAQEACTVFCIVRMSGFFVCEHHCFGCSDELEFENSVHKEMLDHYRETNMILPGVGSGYHSAYRHKERLPWDIEPADLPRFCKGKAQQIPMQWGPKYCGLLSKVSHGVLHRFPHKTKNTITKHIVGSDIKPLFPKYHKLINTPTDAVQVTLTAFHKVIEKGLDECKAVETIPRFINTALWNEVLDRIRTETESKRKWSHNRRNKVTFNDIVETERHDDIKKEKREDTLDASDQVEVGMDHWERPYYTNLISVDISGKYSNPVEKFIAQNIHRTAKENYNLLQKKGFSIHLRKVERLQKEIKEIFHRTEFNALKWEREFYSQVWDAKRLVRGLRKVSPRKRAKPKPVLAHFSAN
jgi:hypothetical protein